MIVMGCDFHPSFQQIAMVDTVTGEFSEHRLSHEGQEARTFYQALARPVRVGMEASGQGQWFESLMAELGHELWQGDAARIRASVVRKQKTNARDARHLLDLMLSGEFPRLWLAAPAERDLWQLLKHRHSLVGMRTRVKNQLQALALKQGLRRRSRLWSQQGRQELEALALAPWAARRRDQLLELLDWLAPQIAQLDQALVEQAQARSQVLRLMTHPGVGPQTALAFSLALGPWQRFRRSGEVASYFGLIPSEHSSGEGQRLGHISKQGNGMVRWLLVEASHSAVRHDPELRRHWLRLGFRRGRTVAQWRWRANWPFDCTGCSAPRRLMRS